MTYLTNNNFTEKCGLQNYEVFSPNEILDFENSFGGVRPLQTSTPTSPENWVHTYTKLRRASALIGASAAAIDSKIAQAMDLVKSHLMFAVHEEIELLKSQIKELVQRNNQLEMENDLLRSAAPTETLARLHEMPPPS